MNKDTFFRMNFILQDNSATTTKTYLAKMIESILFDSKCPLTLDGIRECLSSKYLLEFSNDEIQASIQKQLNKTDHLILLSNKYSLSAEYANKLSTNDSVDSLLHKYVNSAIVELSLAVEEHHLFSLITKYLYHCFNTNKSVLLSLIEGIPITDTETFSVSNDDILLINAFLSWNNDSKNKLIYQIVSYCYVYCTLNTKKDVLLSKSIFKNKHFFLDANIIFRMAGINNDDRQNTITSFVNKCNEVGIKLSFTSATLDEIYRVISSKVNWIKGTTHSKEPININLETYGNDFYNLYTEWCKKPGNNYSDFHSFQSYLTALVNNVLQNLDYVVIKDFNVIDNKDFKCYIESLKEHKYKNSSRAQSNVSLETDVNNTLYLLDQRRDSKKGSLFSTNIFFISADQNLVVWSQNVAPGVPLIVLPSIWLTILLRFTGRSNDDYQSFVSFMNLRTHNSDSGIDIFSLIRELGFHTDDKILKEKIISEIILHKDDYVNINSTAEDIVYKAFDTIRSQENQEKDLEFEKQITNREDELIKEREESLHISQDQERNKNILLLVTNKISSKQKIPDFINKIKYPIAIIIGLLLIITAGMWLYNVEPVHSIYEKAFPKSLESVSDKMVFVGSIWVVLGVAYGVLCNISNKYVSEQHISKLRNKYTQEFSLLLNKLESN